MPIVGFNLDKINVEKKNSVKGNVEVKNNVTITNIEEKELSLGSAKKDGLKFSFEYETSYEPKIGGIMLTGTIMYVEENKKKKEDILARWKKDKKLTEENAPEILNTILMRCSVKTLTLAQDVNLPPHIPLPKLTPKVDPSRYIG